MWLSFDNVCARIRSGNDCKDKKNRFPCSPHNYLEDTTIAGGTILLCRCESWNRTRSVVAAGTGGTPAAFYLGLCRLRGILSLPASHDCAAGGPFSFAATKIRIGRGRLLLCDGCGRGRCHSGGFLLRIMPPSWHPVPACTRNGHSAGRPFFLATTTKLQAEPFYFAAKKIRIGCRSLMRRGQTPLRRLFT